jgi:hypothetical protein
VREAALRPCLLTQRKIDAVQQVGLFEWFDQIAERPRF